MKRLPTWLFFGHIFSPSSETSQHKQENSKHNERHLQSSPEAWAGIWSQVTAKTDTSRHSCLSTIPPALTWSDLSAVLDPRRPKRILNTVSELMLELYPKFWWLLLLKLLAGTFAFGAPRSTSPFWELNYHPWFLQSQPGRLESCWTWNTPVSKLTQSLWQSRHPWFPETLI